MRNPDMGVRILNLRVEKDYTRDELADKASISSKFLYEIELGKKGCSAEILRRVASALDISSDYLLTGDVYNKVPISVTKMLECFNAEQIDIFCDVLKNVLEICLCENQDQMI